ncbi:M81 family metallopeptidase [Roseomonas frigidaquae]|uniref:M81 family metallopeptidase n=1 Tax=Falsiroseomonas frigidaquae TaxID=487318 RepID=A0ABX1F1N4_9PROT|nr:M81 family metallopeptidase [Falsiroseomonas frigidaquae]NKE46247.1 M81 family metallopeptidase [Falsiroseomonas frigidaquae]
MMRAAVASFEFEGNSLSLRVTRRADFERSGIFESAALLEAAAGKDLALTGGIDTLRAAGMELVPVFAAKGGAGGHIEDSFFAEARSRIVEGIAAALPLQGVYIAMHGAMICAEEKDPEGAILAALRARIGPGIPIAVSLDLHAHVTHRMAAAADIIVGYETYPHVDAYRTGACAAGLLVRTMQGAIRPLTRIRKYNAIVPVLGGATLGDAPMAQVAAEARALEAAGRALSVSYFPVQPWLDMADVGITGVAVTDADAPAADAAAQAILDAMWTRRRDFELPALIPAEAVQEALRREGRTLLIDAPDSIGAGASGDAPALLAALLAHAPEVESALCIVDPGAAAKAGELGEGAEAIFEIGAWQDRRWFKPVPVTARVERLCDGLFTYRGGPVGGATGRLGPSAVLRAGGLRILVTTHAVYEHMDEHYAACGIDIGGCRLVSFKNLMNYQKLLGPGVGFIALHGPGGAPLRLQDVAWEKRQRPFWPAEDMPQPVTITRDT